MKAINGSEPLNPPASSDSGIVRGKHFTSYVEEVKELRRHGDDQSAERLLLESVDATEAEAAANGDSLVVIVVSTRGGT
jgi:hypothetical protein